MWLTLQNKTLVFVRIARLAHTEELFYEVAALDLYTERSLDLSSAH